MAFGARTFGSGGAVTAGGGWQDALRAGVTEAFAPDDEPQYGMYEYARLIPAPKVGELRLDDFPYQAEPFYSDAVADAEEVVAMKATQVGASEAYWRWILRRVDVFGETGIYYFPTDTHVTDFSDERISPAIRGSSYLRRRISPESVKSKHLKQIGAGTLYFRGVKSQVGVQSVAADAIVFDEYDEADPRQLAQAERRLSGARAAGRVPRVRRIGRPSIPGYGIDAAYQESDRRVWRVRCPKCETEQEITFWDNLRWRTHAGGKEVMRAGHDTYAARKDVTEAWRACRECDASLEGDPLRSGRWVATAPGPGRVRGYHITRLIVPRTDLIEIVRASRATRTSDIEIFYWADLGLAWAPADARLTDDDLDRAATGEPLREEYRGTLPVTAGLDVAGERDLTIRISEHRPDGRRHAIYLGEPSGFEEVEQLMGRFDVDLLVVDSNPERRHARGLANAYPGRVWLADYDDNPRADAFRYSKEKNLFHVNRTEAIDAMMDAIRQGQNVLPEKLPPRYREQMKALVRRIEEDARGRPRRVYVTTGQEGDDFAHAEVYDLVAAEVLAIVGRVQDEVAAERVLTEEDLGYAPVRLAALGDEYDPGFGEGGI